MLLYLMESSSDYSVFKFNIFVISFSASSCSISIYFILSGFGIKEGFKSFICIKLRFESGSSKFGIKSIFFIKSDFLKSISLIFIYFWFRPYWESDFIMLFSNGKFTFLFDLIDKVLCGF